MTEAVKERSLFSSPAMSVEGSPELELPRTPIRFSGIVALFLGLISFVAILGASLIVVPVVAILISLFAMRPYSQDRPVGIAAAWVGLFLAVMFGVWGYSERQFKIHSMSREASQFAKNWLELVGQGDHELAIELQVHPSRRQPESMPLADYYQRGEEAQNLLKQFREQDVMPALISLGSEPKWELAMPPKVYLQYGRELTQTVWRDASGKHKELVKVVLEYLQGNSDDKAHWKIELVSTFMDDRNRL